MWIKRIILFVGGLFVMSLGVGSFNKVWFGSYANQLNSILFDTGFRCKYWNYNSNFQCPFSISPNTNFKKEIQSEKAFAVD